MADASYFYQTVTFDERVSFRSKNVSMAHLSVILEAKPCVPAMN